MEIDKLIYGKESYRIIGACMAVHRELGCGMREMVYGDALEEEFKLQGIPYEREYSMMAVYKGIELKHSFVCDFICYEHILLEIKAERELNDINRSQVINYLKISKLPLGLLINFGESSLKYERYLL
ncbi:NADH:ubiquinone oxidoreductase [Hoylesella timonensis]|uniref:NADH:ubiquinone oxidoreductase n=1 Tax=Hoylesella timonensis TaxID=386414 RepID=A0A2K0XNA8_9BACT|nr:GxxExxY protein [Hoylesella timonensis]PNP96037.1 NADH:ubiquinone oxidoreductase [Hoylesella timonensis]